MSDPSFALQVGIVATLKATSAVTALVVDRIYDEVPRNPEFPYVTLGDMQVLPDKADCIDGTEISVQVDVWSRTQGFKEAKQIGAAIVAALDDQLIPATGYTVVVFEIENINYLRDPDGKTRHGALTFHALIQLA